MASSIEDVIAGLDIITSQMALSGSEKKEVQDAIQNAEYTIVLYDGERRYDIDDVIGFSETAPKVGQLFDNPYSIYQHFKVILVDYANREIYVRSENNI